jgi:hypothetical protein
LDGTLTAQWVVLYPPHDYFFAWRGQTTSMHSQGSVRAQFRSQETYTAQVFNATANRTETVEKKYGFDVTFYTYDSGGKHIIRQYTNVTEIDETFRESHQAGIYCDVTDIHGWTNEENRDPWTSRTSPYHWLGARKWTASPKWTTEQVIISAVVLVIVILLTGQERLSDYMEIRRRRKLRKKRQQYQVFRQEDDND